MFHSLIHTFPPYEYLTETNLNIHMQTAGTVGNLGPKFMCALFKDNKFRLWRNFGGQDNPLFLIKGVKFSLLVK